MQTIRTPVLEIAFESGGPEEGSPVLLLHGWPDDATAWGGFTPALERAGCRWVAPVRGVMSTAAPAATLSMACSARKKRNGQRGPVKLAWTRPL